MSKVLVIAAHPDDEILGVAATIRKHVENGDECEALILGEGVTSRYDNRENYDVEKLNQLQEDTIKAGKIIGYKNVYTANLRDNRFDSYDLLHIVKIIEKYVDKIKPDIIYTHHHGDLNVDHKVTFEAVITGTRPISDEIVREIYCFETVSSTEWSFIDKYKFNPNYFVDVTGFMEYKLEAMKQYTGELRESPHPRSLDNLLYTAKKWGSIINCEYAEVFEVVRMIKK